LPPYFYALNWTFLIESLTGIRVLKVMANREEEEEEEEEEEAKVNAGLTPEIQANNKKMFLGGAVPCIPWPVCRVRSA